MPEIVVDRVLKAYQRGTEKLPVLNGLSLLVEPGDFLALMGPSGSGKTTLLNLVAGLDVPDEGRITVAGQELAALGERELARWRSHNIGFIFQFYNLIPVLSAQENVSLPLLLFPMSQKERRERAEFALNLVGLADRAGHLPSQLSGGQEQRVAIARAIVTDPRIIVADEPTGDLDRHSAVDVMTLLQKLHREHKKTVVMVTHDPHAAEYASHVVHLDKGELAV